MGTAASRSMRWLGVTIAVVMCPGLGTSLAQGNDRTTRTLWSFDRSSLSFIENKGQWDSQAHFLCRTPNLDACMDVGGIRLLLPSPHERGRRECVLVCLDWVNHNSAVEIDGQTRLPGYYNYLIGRDQTRWRTRVPAYSQVRYRDLYDGIDLVVREGETGGLEYDLLLAPGASVENVRVRCRGIEGLYVIENGSLVLQTGLGPLTQTPPRTWQELSNGERRSVECRFRRLSEDTYGFLIVGAMDPTLPLTIDPSLHWSTLLGGSGVDLAMGLAIGSNAEPILAGFTSSSLVPDSFPTTPGVFQGLAATSGGSGDGFVTRLTTDGSALIYSTFFGGSAADEVLFAAIHDATQEVIVTGYTESSDLPVTAGAFDPTYNPGLGDRDVFVARLTSDGTALVYSTYLGGGEDETPWSMALDDSGEATVVGSTESPDFPTTPLAYDTTFDGSRDAFVTRISTDGTTLSYSTFLGGSLFDEALGVALTGSGAAVVCGKTSSADFPVTPTSFDPTINPPMGVRDGFVARLTPDGGDLVFGTYLGTTSGIWLTDIAIDALDRPVIVGFTAGVDFPTTPDAFSEVLIGGNDVVVARLDSTGSNLEYGSYFGGSLGSDIPWSIALESSGDLVVVGQTNSVDFPTTVDALDANFDGFSAFSPNDGFVTRLRLGGAGSSGLLYSTYLGGMEAEDIHRVRLDEFGRALVTGRTSSSTFPVTSGAYQVNHGGGTDAFLLRLELIAPEFRRGDSNGDGAFDVADAVSVLTTLFVAGAPSLGCEDAGDANDDGILDVSDAVHALAAIFVAGSPATPAPGTVTCGEDPTSDALDCETYAACP